MIIITSIFVFNFTNICVIVFLAKLLTLSILFSTAVRAVLVTKLVILSISTLTSFSLVWRAAVAAKLVILGISPLTSFTLALRKALVAKLVIPGILSSIFFYLSIIYLFLTASFFTSSLSLLRSIGTGFNSSTFELSTLIKVS